MATSRRHGPLIALLLLLAFAFQGARGLWDPDEGRYTAVALEMLDSGDWLHPRLHPEQPHYTKPPLTYWAIAASIGAFGHHEWAARLPNALAFFLTSLLAWGLASRLGLSHAPMAALVYATTVLPFAAANILTTDTLLTLWETLAMWAFVAGWRNGMRFWQPLMWCAFGLAFLTKGPPGMLPLLALAFWLAREGDRGRLLALFHPAGVALFLLVGLGWYALVIRDTPGLLDYFLHKEVAGRILTSGHHRHGEWYGGFEIYLPTLLIGALPWWPLAWRACRHSSRAGGDGHARRFLLYWLAAPLLVFMLARSRLPLYLLPLFVPLTLLMHRSLASAFASFHAGGTRLALGAGILLILARGAAGLVPNEADSRQFAALLSPLITPDIRELVFVDTHPRYGLRFYLDRTVELVNWESRADRMAFQPHESLVEELRDDPLPRLFLVPAGQEASRLERRMKASGIVMDRLGVIGGLSVFRYPASADRIKPGG